MSISFVQLKQIFLVQVFESLKIYSKNLYVLFDDCLFTIENCQNKVILNPVSVFNKIMKVTDPLSPLSPLPLWIRPCTMVNCQHKDI